MTNAASGAGEDTAVGESGLDTGSGNPGRDRADLQDLPPAQVADDLDSDGEDASEEDDDR